MTDLHCHILPRMDDGPKNAEKSVELVRAQRTNGITQAVATPHFTPESDSLERFVERREQALSLLKQSLARAGVSFGVTAAAEVLLHPSLPELAPEPLCISGTPLMLVELPNEDRWPLWGDDVLYRLQLKGVEPVLAHVCRYPFLLRRPDKLAALAQGGVRLQVNADSLLQPLLRRTLLRLFRRQMISFVATDCHSAQWRPPRLKEAVRTLQKRLPANECAALWRNADAVFAGQVPPLPEVRPNRPTFWHPFD